ncbi:MAG TPA: 4Fe-4S dicluster domain-containing protein [Thermoanaerobaculia bacterium]
MSTRVVPGLAREIRRYGSLDANACLNCGCCTVVCDLSSGSAAFPRKPIRLALLGLRDLLRRSLDPWLCHDCRDCSTFCPREARPAEAMATLRRYLAAQYDVTGLASLIQRSKLWAISVLVLTALLVLALAYGYHQVEVGLSGSDLLTMPMGLEHMFGTITVFTRVVLLIPLVLLLAGGWRMHRMALGGIRIPLRSYGAEAKTFLLHMVTQRRMKECPQEERRRAWAGHWLLALSFAAMSVILFFLLRWFQTDAILPLWNPQRWLGYLIAAVMIAVPAQMLVKRLRSAEGRAFARAEDLTLPILILLTAVSGMAVHVARYQELALTAHLAYAIHIAISVPLLVIELPFGKLSHALYRPLAIYFLAVRERALAVTKLAPAGAGAPETIEEEGAA